MKLIKLGLPLRALGTRVTAGNYYQRTQDTSSLVAMRRSRTGGRNCSQKWRSGLAT